MEPRPEKYRQYDTDGLNHAYEAVSNGMSVYKASRQYGVPESTLRDRTRGNVSLNANPGPDRLFTHEEEKELVDHIKYTASIGYGYSKANVQYLASEFAVACKKRNSSETPLSERWFYGFMKRWPDLHLSKPQKLTMIRAKSASKETIDAYYKELRTILTKNSLHEKPQRIYNIDETGLFLEHTPPKIISAKNSKPQACTSSRSNNITIIGGGNAVGNNIPPYYVFPGKRWNNSFLTGTPAGSNGECSESGWSNSSIFHNYMTRHFVKYVNLSKEEPLLVLYDGHKSHIQLTLLDWSKKHNIILFVLPPHTSRLTQPLDVGCFGPLKSVYNYECQQYLRRNPGIHITKYEVGQLSGKAYIKSMTPENLASAFRKAGVYPCDKSVITSDDIAPSQIYQNSPSKSITDRPLPDDPVINTTVAAEPSTSALSDIIPVANVNNNSSFFESCKITTATNRPARKFKPPYLSGDLSKHKNVAILESTAKQQKQKTAAESFTKPVTGKRKQRSTDGKKSKFSKQESAKKQENIAVQGTSGLSSRKEGPIPLDSESSDFSESESESSDEKCCVCEKFTPAEVRQCTSIIFTKWAKCDFCPHWTHLSFCCDTTVIRRGDSFRCPHCLSN